jgi:hypothetical protein
MQNQFHITGESNAPVALEQKTNANWLSAKLANGPLASRHFLSA